MFPIVLMAHGLTVLSRGTSELAAVFIRNHGDA